MKLSFTSLSTAGWSVGEMIDFADETGYEGVELRCDYGPRHRVTAGHRDVPRTTETEVAQLREHLADADAELCLLGTSAEFGTGDLALRRAHVDEVTAYVELADRLDCPLVKVFANRGPIPDDTDREQAADYTAACLAEVDDVAAEHDVTVVLEEHGPDWTDAGDLLSVLDAADADNVGVLWHLKEDEHEPLRQLGDSLAHLHVRDYDPFEGDVLETLDDIGYEGYLSYERGDGRESLETYESTVRKLV